MAAFTDIINFDKAVSLEQSFDTEIPLEMLQRLQDAVIAVHSPVHAKYSFFRDPQGLRTIEGFVECEKLVLRCERCGNEMEIAVRADFSSTCDGKKVRMLRLDDKYDTVEVTEAGDFNLLDYIEDCLLLEIPYAPKHEENDPECESGSDWSYGEVPDEGPSPLALALGDLKSRLKF